jgi:NHL repeat-containing protein
MGESGLEPLVLVRVEPVHAKDPIELGVIFRQRVRFEDARLGFGDLAQRPERDGRGDLYVSDSSGARIRIIDTPGSSQRSPERARPDIRGTGPATAATLNQPYGLAVDRLGRLYVADVGNGVVRMVDRQGIIRTVVRGS